MFAPGAICVPRPSPIASPKAYPARQGDDLFICVACSSIGKPTTTRRFRTSLRGDEEAIARA